MSLCLVKNHALETYGGNAGTNPRIAQHQRPGLPLCRKLILHNSFKWLFYLILMYFFIIPFNVMLFATFFTGTTAPSRPGLPHYRGFTITLRPTTLCMTPPEEWSARRRDVYLTTYNTHETDFYAPGGIQTRNLSKRAAADPRLCPRGHQYRCLLLYVNKYF